MAGLVGQRDPVHVLPAESPHGQAGRNGGINAAGKTDDDTPGVGGGHGLHNKGLGDRGGFGGGNQPIPVVVFTHHVYTLRHVEGSNRTSTV